MTRSDAELRSWAHEHLIYEAGMLLHTCGAAANPDLDAVDQNALIESFAVHVRCLRDFLWKDQRMRAQDALASDFCAPNIWRIARGDLPPALAEIEGERNRIGREIVHLTYHRLDIDSESKAWRMGEILQAILECLARFVHTADPRRITGKTQQALRLMIRLVPRDGEPLRIGPYIPGWSPATGAIQVDDDYAGGTIPFPGFSSSDADEAASKST